MTTTTTSPPPTFQLREKIDLTDKESQIFELLLQVVSHFSLQTEIRVAGGWVRDKLLGRKCNDIDIALDKVMGTEFAEKINEYLSSLGKEKLSFNFIPSNPDQSKHLETAKMRFDGIEIDFVNLRSEEYSENNRIPKMEFGTAKEDAERRDLTINSLFYNINTGSVDDFTERGIADLRSGRIATPLAAKQTFLDDPLRVLRAIRFGARFGFILDEALKVAASDNDVKAALAKKISKERIGAELDLMISGNQPVNAMTHIYELQLFSIIFDLPPKFEPAASEERLCVSYMDAAWRLVQLIGCSTFNDEKRRLSLYAALLLPFRKTVCRVKKNKTIPWVSHIFRNSLKLNLSDADTVVSLHNATEKFTSLIPFITSKSNEDTQIAEVDCKGEVVDKSKLRMLIGLLLRELKDFWRAVLLLSLLLYPTDIACTDSQVKHFELDKRIALFETVESEIIKLGLEKVWVMKPLLNGTDIITVLQLKTGGPLIGQLLQKVIEWQLVHPSGTLEECIDWLRQTHSNFLGADTFPVRKRKVGHPLT